MAKVVILIKFRFGSNCILWSSIEIGPKVKIFNKTFDVDVNTIMYCEVWKLIQIQLKRSVFLGPTIFSSSNAFIGISINDGLNKGQDFRSRNCRTVITYLLRF